MTGHIRITIIAVLAAALAAAVASAQDMDYPKRENVRPLVIPRGYLEFTAGFSWLKTEQYFNHRGEIHDSDMEITEMAMDASAAIGIYDGLELRVGIPYIIRELDTDGSPSAEGFGDLDASLLLQIFRQTSDRPTSVVLGVRGIFPIGESEIGNDSEMLMHPPGRGTFAVGPFIWVREAYTRYLGFQYTFEWDFYLKGKEKFMGVTADTDYGDVMRVSLEPIFQASDSLAIWLSFIFTRYYRSTFEDDGLRIGEYPRSELFQIRPAVEIQLGRNVDLFLGTEYRPYGRYAYAGWPIWTELEIRF